MVRAIVQGRENHLSLRDLRSQLLVVERRVEGNFSVNYNVAAMIAHASGSMKGGRGNNMNWNSGDNENKKQGKSYGANSECQVCGRRGHTVETCFQVNPCQICGNYGHLTTSCYKNPENKHQELYKSQFRSSSNGSIPECQICSKRWHTSANCYFRSETSIDQGLKVVIVCQICGIKGHVALNCSNRANFAYQGVEPPSFPTALSAQVY